MSEDKRIPVTLSPEEREAIQNDQTLWTETEKWRFETKGKLPPIGELIRRSIARDQRKREKKPKTSRFDM